jgi:hypothetical protein
MKLESILFGTFMHIYCLKLQAISVYHTAQTMHSFIEGDFVKKDINLAIQITRINV